MLDTDPTIPVPSPSKLQNLLVQNTHTQTGEASTSEKSQTIKKVKLLREKYDDKQKGLKTWQI